MPPSQLPPPGETPQDSANRQTASLAGLAIVLALVVVGLLLLLHLRREARLEDCLMSGRLNCDALLVTPAAPRPD